MMKALKQSPIVFKQNSNVWTKKQLQWHNDKKPNPLWWFIRIPALILAIILAILTIIFSFIASFVWNPDERGKTWLKNTITFGKEPRDKSLFDFPFWANQLERLEIAHPLVHDAHKGQRQTDSSDSVSEDWYGSAQHRLVLEPSD